MIVDGAHGIFLDKLLSGVHTERSREVMLISNESIVLTVKTTHFYSCVGETL